MKKTDFIKHFKKSSLPSKLTYMSTFFSVGIVITMFFSTLFSKSDSDINNKINELDNIKVALNTLDNYVSSQQEGLKDLSNEIAKLKEEKESISTILEIEQEKLNSYLLYQTKLEKRKMWWNMAFSFLIGVLSSSVVTIIAMRMQKSADKKKEELITTDAKTE